MSNPQVLVNTLSGDRVVFDVVGLEQFKGISAQLYQEHAWVEFNDNAVVRKDQITSIYYLKDGYSSGTLPNAS